MNSKWFHIGIAAGAILASTLAVHAADISRQSYKAPLYSAPADFNWTGLYIGINGGYGFGSSHHNFDVVGTTTGSYDISGAVAGLTVGYNWQLGRWVYGVEGDFDWSGIKGTAPCPGPGFTCGTDSTWLGTARGRFGYAFDRWLPYITAGAAFGNIKATIDPSSAAFPGASATRIGWTGGAGVEYALWQSWSVKAEYLYVSLGDMDCATGCSGIGADKVGFKASLVRGGINYRF